MPSHPMVKNHVMTNVKSDALFTSASYSPLTKMSKAIQFFIYEL